MEHLNTKKELEHPKLCEFLYEKLTIISRDRDVITISVVQNFFRDLEI